MLIKYLKCLYLKIYVFYYKTFGNLIENILFKSSGVLVSRPNINIGEFTYGVKKHTIICTSDQTKVEIGKFCSIAQGVKIIAHGEHPLEFPSQFPFKSLFVFKNNNSLNFKTEAVTKGDIIIGNDVWIGENAIILSGITIGNGAVIGAGSVVTKNVDDYAIFAGNPAKLIRYRFSETDRQSLLNSKWWELEVNKLEEIAGLFYQNDISKFTNAANSLRKIE